MNLTYEDKNPFGHFDDSARQYVITDPLTPKPWTNYLGNGRLSAFVTQNAGGMLWHIEPQTRRISRYHYIPAPADRPGFYLYVKDRRTGKVWNPHFAPTCAPLDSFECRHSPGVTRFIGVCGGASVELSLAIPPGDDVMLWDVRVTNVSSTKNDIDLLLCSYIEFGLLEATRELWWAYLKAHIGFTFDKRRNAVRYDYHAFEAPHTPRMLFAYTADKIAGFDCSRDDFIGRGGSLERPGALCGTRGFGQTELPGGGHGCGAIGVDVKLAAGQSKSFAYVFAIGPRWEDAEALVEKYRQPGAAARGIESASKFWEGRLGRFTAQTGDAAVDRFVNTWNPYNCCITLEHARIISTDHVGLDGLRYRDTTQDALAVAHLDPTFATERMRLVFAQQTPDGGGCYAFYPHNPIPTLDQPHRGDNTVWQVDTIKALIVETGNSSILDEQIPFRNGNGAHASIYDHVMLGLKHIYERRGKRIGLPMLFHADWNDGLALFGDEAAESVMLGMQLVHACKEMIELAERKNRSEDIDWCRRVVRELTEILNSDAVWDGQWYRRLLLSNGKHLGGHECRQGSIFLEPQVWAVISGVADSNGRGRVAMDAVARLLDTDAGLRILDPAYKGIPEPEDPPKGSSPGTNENGAIFCHANTWAVIAEAMLGRPERAFKYYRQLLPESVIARFGAEHYQREPYVYVSSITGPASERFGQAGISWLTGTASWMYIAATQYLLGIRPTLRGLSIRPCLPESIRTVNIRRTFRGCAYDIQIDNTAGKQGRLTIDDQPIAGNIIPELRDGQPVCRVKWRA